jgi:hypothetical protein
MNRILAVLAALFIGLGVIHAPTADAAQALTVTNTHSARTVACWGETWTVELYWHHDSINGYNAMYAFRAYRNAGGNDTVAEATFDSNRYSGYLHTAITPATTNTGIRNIQSWVGYWPSQTVDIYLSNANYNQCPNAAHWNI